MTIVYVIVAAVIGAALGALLGKSGKRAGAATATDETVAKLRSAAEAEAAEIKKAAELAGQELAAKRKSELDDELRARKAEVAKREEALGSGGEKNPRSEEGEGGGLGGGGERANASRAGGFAEVDDFESGEVPGEVGAGAGNGDVAVGPAAGAGVPEEATRGRGRQIEGEQAAGAAGDVGDLAEDGDSQAVPFQGLEPGGKGMGGGGEVGHEERARLASHDCTPASGKRAGVDPGDAPEE